MNITLLTNNPITIKHPRNRNKLVRLYRIIANEDLFILNTTIPKGTIGGFVEKIENLNNSWVVPNSKIFDSAIVSNSLISGNSFIFDSARVEYSKISINSRIFNNAEVVNCEVSGKVDIHGNSKVNNSIIKDSAVIRGTAEVAFSEITQGAFISGPSKVNSCVIRDVSSVTGNSTLIKCTLTGKYRADNLSAKDSELHTDIDLNLEAPERDYNEAFMV